MESRSSKLFYLQVLKSDAIFLCKMFYVQILISIFLRNKLI